MSRYGRTSNGYWLPWKLMGNGGLSSWWIPGAISGGGVRPVFYLDASKTKLTGSGTYDDPFVAMPINGLINS